MNQSPKPARVIIADDLPADYVRRLYGTHISPDTVIVSRVDRLREALVRGRRSNRGDESIIRPPISRQFRR